MLRFVRWYINCCSEVTDIVKDMLKNQYNINYVILTFFSFTVYICLTLGAKCKYNYTFEYLANISFDTGSGRATMNSNSCLDSMHLF